MTADGRVPSEKQASRGCDWCDCTAFVGGDDAKFCGGCGHTRENHSRTADATYGASSRRSRKVAALAASLAVVATAVGVWLAAGDGPSTERSDAPSGEADDKTIPFGYRGEGCPEGNPIRLNSGDKCVEHDAWIDVIDRDGGRSATPSELRLTGIDIEDIRWSEWSRAGASGWGTATMLASSTKVDIELGDAVVCDGYSAFSTAQIRFKDEDIPDQEIDVSPEDCERPDTEASTPEIAGTVYWMTWDPDERWVQEPESIVPGNATWFVDARWENWGAPVASARATVWDYDPAISGKYDEVAGTVEVSNIQRCDGRLTYTRVAVFIDDELVNEADAAPVPGIECAAVNAADHTDRGNGATSASAPTLCSSTGATEYRVLSIEGTGFPCDLAAQVVKSAAEGDGQRNPDGTIAVGDGWSCDAGDGRVKCDRGNGKIVGEFDN